MTRPLSFGLKLTFNQLVDSQKWPHILWLIPGAAPPPRKSGAKARTCSELIEGRRVSRMSQKPFRVAFRPVAVQPIVAEGHRRAFCPPAVWRIHPGDALGGTERAFCPSAAQNGSSDDCKTRRESTAQHGTQKRTGDRSRDNSSQCLRQPCAGFGLCHSFGSLYISETRLIVFDRMPGTSGQFSRTARPPRGQDGLSRRAEIRIHDTPRCA